MRSWKLVAWRLLPLLLIVIAAGFWIYDVQEGGAYVVRNWLPLAVLVLLALSALWVGHGHWGGKAIRMSLGTAGFAIPALGLSLYLHYAYAVNLNNLFGDSDEPYTVFAYLPVYTLIAGVIGFAIGWIVGRNV